ncbi:MAG: HRDC domain-containing protein [Pseudomonadota bacterium]
MKLKIFTFRFSESHDGFNDEPLQAFIAEKEVIDYSDHFFSHEKTPYLTVILSYRDIAPDEKRRSGRRRDPREDLDEREKIAYDALRAWRAARAAQEGIPPYMIANNRQVAKMVKIKATSKADLEKIEGIGEAKVAKYGEEILGVLTENLMEGQEKRGAEQ